MMNGKHTASDFCSQLWSSWIRLDSAYIRGKKDSKAEAQKKK